MDNFDSRLEFARHLSNPDPSIELDNLCYSFVHGRACCVWTAQDRWEFPRRLISVQGVVVPVQEIEEPSREPDAHREHFEDPRRNPTVVCIPSSIQKLNIQCFRSGEFCLSVIAFEPNSQLSEFANNALDALVSLSSICIPAGVEKLERSCLAGCHSLSSVTFESGSKLSFIGERCFTVMVHFYHFAFLWVFR
jgi:hypothetical protein